MRSIGSAKPPASVPGAVMAEVEALAQRIEADYDRRQLEVAGQTATAASQGQSLAQSQTRSQASRYGQAGRSNAISTGRRFAIVG